MAISATEILQRHLEGLQPEIAKLIREGHDPFHFPGLHFTRESTGSVALNKIQTGAIIMAGSGMCTGGRVRHHLKHNLWRSELSIVFVGYAASGTLARQIIDGAKEVNIFGERFRCELASTRSTVSPPMRIRPSGRLGKSKLVQSGLSSFTARRYDAKFSRTHLGNTRVELPEPNQVFEL